MNNKIWLSSPHMGGNEEAYVKEAFETNWIAPLGPNVNNFEHDLATYCGVKSVAALSSGTGALHLALILLGIKAGDEVMCQSFTFSASANPIRYQQATPVFIDSEPHTWNMDPIALEEAIVDRRSKGKQPKAIIIVHLYGMPAKMDDILDIARKYNVPVIEDAAEALGSSYNGLKCGSFGDFGILSFNGNKIITTSGGGALLSNDEKMIQKARFLATQARDDAPHYQHSHIGYNYRMSNIVAGIGRGQMEVIEDRVKARRRVHDFYITLLDDVDGIEVLREPNERFFSNMWLTTITIDSQVTGFTREVLRLRLLEDNIESRPLWKPMHLQPVFNEYPYYGGNIAEKLFTCGLCLPSGSNMSDQDLERIKHSIMQEINKHV